MFSSVPLRPARIEYTGTHPFVSTVYFHFRHKLSLYINLVCFDSVSAKYNLVQLYRGAVRQAFSCALSGVRGRLRKSARQNSVWIKCLTVKALKHANNVLMWLRISAVSREFIDTEAPELKLNVRCSTILRYFSKSRLWRHFYRIISINIISHSPTWKERKSGLTCVGVLPSQSSANPLSSSLGSPRPSGSLPAGPKGSHSYPPPFERVSPAGKTQRGAGCGSSQCL